jgi:hypothetical protein
VIAVVDLRSELSPRLDRQIPAKSRNKIKVSTRFPIAVRLARNWADGWAGEQAKHRGKLTL